MRKKITLSPSNLDNLLWCATRYCIGRHSYVNSYAQEFWRIIQANRQKLNKNRLLLFARDIRTEISDRVHCYDNVSVKNAYNNYIKYDALTLLAEYARQHPEVKEHETFYEIDCISGKVLAFPWDDKDKRPYAIPFQVCNIHDLPYWALLANCIDRQYEVKLAWDGNERTEFCVKHPIDESYVVVSNWHTSVIEEYIAEVTPLFNDIIKSHGT